MIEVMDGSGSSLALYTGDYKPGPRTDRTIEALAGRCPIIIMETTKMDDKSVTEGVVRATMYRIIKDRPNDAIIVVAPPNHLERLETIYEIAEATGRHVALSPAHAEVTTQLRAEREKLQPLGVDGFDFFLPEIGQDAALWWRALTSPRIYQKELNLLASAGQLGVVDRARLSEEKDKWIVVVSPFAKLRHDFGGAYLQDRVTALHASYYTYERHAKYMVGENLRWINEQNGQYYMDFEVAGVGGRTKRVVHRDEAGNVAALHATGHVNFEESVQTLDALMGGNYKGKTVILIHGETPVVYERKLRERLGLDRTSDLNVISRISRYDPKNPLKKPGFSFRLA
jgi:mRNA degradation ribonuclease J1/J2